MGPRTARSVSDEPLRLALPSLHDRQMSIHATAISFAGQGVLLAGPSGAGKSQLALRLIYRGAWLVADDQTILAARDGQVWASCPPPIAGKLEVRGVGIVAAPHQVQALLRLVLDLSPSDPSNMNAVRMPDFRHWTLPPGLENTCPIPCVPFDAFRPDAAEAVIAALAQSRDWEDSPAL